MTIVLMEEVMHSVMFQSMMNASTVTQEVIFVNRDVMMILTVPLTILSVILTTHVAALTPLTVWVVKISVTLTRMTTVPIVTPAMLSASQDVTPTQTVQLISLCAKMTTLVDVLMVLTV